MKQLSAIFVFLLFASACGSGSNTVDQLQSASDSASESTSQTTDIEGVDDALGAFNRAQGLESGGKGTLTFDGVDYPLDFVVCPIDTSTGDDWSALSLESRVQVFLEGEIDDLNPSVFDADSVQWFDGDGVNAATQSVVTSDGKTFTTPTTTWWNNRDDRVVEGTFTFTCP